LAIHGQKRESRTLGVETHSTQHDLRLLEVYLLQVVGLPVFEIGAVADVFAVVGSVFVDIKQ